MEFLHEGSAQTIITEGRASELVDGLLAQLRQRGPLRRVLILPPDITRMHSWAGFLTCRLYEKLHPSATVAILPTIGTHAPMTEAEIKRMYPGIPAQVFHVHDWRGGVVPLGEVPAALIHEVSEGKLEFPVR